MTEIVQRLLVGDQRALSQALTLLERGGPEAASLMKQVDQHAGRAYTVGVTGPPGVGKSTIVTRLTEVLRRQDLKVGIIAVDPTSPFTSGALLGDRIRMQSHYLDDGVFIRSVASKGQVGGLPRMVKGMVRLLDASGKDLVLVETVGVGQTELGIMEVADTVVVALMPESGDAIQTLKAGVLEIADLFLVNKADREGANQMAAAITAMLHMALTSPEWSPPVLLTKASTGEGIDELWDRIQEHRAFLARTSALEQRRETRRRREFLEAVEEELGRRLKALVEQDPGLAAALEDIAAGKAEPYSSALEFLDSRHLSELWPTSRRVEGS